MRRVLVAALLCGTWATSPVLAEEASNAPQTEDGAWPGGVEQEADLPAGFPPPGPLGEVVEKSYPPMRTFWAEGNMNFAFWKCFQHLQEHEHEMTAPVMWDYQHRDAPAPPLEERLAGSVQVERLHFVLEDPTRDEPGEYGAVTVSDAPEMQVLSVAFQGRLTAEVVRDCENKLQASLAEREGWESAGPPRILGYNSPMIPEQRRYWEVQLPIQAAE